MTADLQVTRIVKSLPLTKSKLDTLWTVARKLGSVRTKVRHDYGGYKFIHQKTPYSDLVTGDRLQKCFPGMTWDFPRARSLIGQTIYDEQSNIKAIRQAAKRELAFAAYRRAGSDKAERKRYKKLLSGRSFNSGAFMEDSYLRRKWRQIYRQHLGTNKCHNQICCGPHRNGGKTWQDDNGRVWLDVAGVAIPLNTTSPFEGGFLRLILKGQDLYVHFAVSALEHCSVRPCGDAVVGINKGYLYVFTDSDGERYGTDLGELLDAKEDYKVEKNRKRAKLRSIAKKASDAKAQRIRENNMGARKYARQMRRFDNQIRDEIYQAVHRLCDKAKEVRCEDLTREFGYDPSLSKKQRNRLNMWVRGTLQDALESVCERRGVKLVQVAPAYISQIDPETKKLLGKKYGTPTLGRQDNRKFVCEDGTIMDEDHVAAINVLDRAEDKRFKTWMGVRQVEKLLLNP